MGTRSRLTLARARASAMRYSPTAARAHYSYSIFYIEYSIVTSCNASEVNYSDAIMASSSSSTSDQGPSLCAVVSTRIMVVYFYVLRIMGEINGNNDYTK